MDYSDARRRMVDSQVRTNDVANHVVQRAFETIAREDFLPPEFAPQAYVEREIVYAAGRSLITARDFAKLLAAMDPRPTDLALDAAAGCGYSSAVLSRLVDMVVAIEPDDALAAHAQDNLEAAGIVNAAVVRGRPEDGSPKQGPFDLILVANAIETEPAALIAQLKDGGRLGAIWRRDGVSKGCIWRKAGSAAAVAEVFDASAAIIAPGFTRKKSFVF
jgi:protein-L-isoaspartate(D-aspartate) O-methyltransferase